MTWPVWDGITIDPSLLTGYGYQTNITVGGNVYPRYLGYMVAGLYQMAFGYVGTTTNDSAPAGYVGEFITANVPIGSAVSLTNNAAANVASITLTAGDWDVWGTVLFNPAGSTTVASLIASISTVSGAVGILPYGCSALIAAVFGTGAAQAIPTTTLRLNLASPGVVYLVAAATFGVSSMGAYGFIGARRRR
jgi:hypothetical protein